MPGKRKPCANTEQRQRRKRTPSPRKRTKGSKQPFSSCSTKNCASSNVTQCIINVQIGQNSVQTLRKVSHGSIINNISSIRFSGIVSPFDRRVTFLTWHPKNSKLLFVGSKGGSIVLWNCEQLLNPDNIIRGKGPGDSILNIICNPEKQDEIYTSSLEGTVGLWNFEHKKHKVLIDLEGRFSLPRTVESRMATSTWCTGLDIDFSGGSMVVGDNSGFLSLISLDGKLQWRARLHKTKISHVEYFKRDNRFLVTASVDHSVKIWDTRFISGSKPEQQSVLANLQHNFAVNSAYFSPSGSGRLLTTDQHSELRVYRSPLWNLERVIPHPHRQFQHITAIKEQTKLELENAEDEMNMPQNMSKATWHPLEDIIVVGRYPDAQFPGYTPEETRSVDFFQAETGKYVYKLTESGVNGIMCLNRFNNVGDILASGMGYNILIWKPKWRGKISPSATKAPELCKAKILRSAKVP